MSFLNIVGFDGKTPIHNPEGNWHNWNIDEIWLGAEGEGKFIPKVNDFVTEILHDSYKTYRVVSLDNITAVPTLSAINPYGVQVLEEIDPLLGVDSSYFANTLRAYLDTNVTPYTLTIDTRALVPGSMTKYAKIYLGPDLNGNAETVAFTLDNSGNILGPKIPLETVAINSHDNYHMKIVTPAKTTLNLEDGEILTVVVYTDEGHKAWSRQVVVERSGIVRSNEITKKYITSIGLRSNFLSETENNQIDLPLNITMQSLQMVGVVNYSDGTKLELPVDGSKFSMLGLDQYVAGITERLNLVLKYQLSPNEISYAEGQTSEREIVVPFSLVTTAIDASYSVKLYVYPEFVSDELGYRLRWFMTNLDRNLLTEVTDLVQFSGSTGAFDPLAYGVTQKKQVAVNLKDVNPTYNDFNHTQMVEITLFSSPNVMTGTNWTVSSQLGSGYLPYGLDISARMVDAYTVNIANGYSDLETWSSHTLARSYPLFNTVTESSPPEATHIRVRYGNEMKELEIDEFGENVTFESLVERHKTVYVDFVRIMGTSVLYLSRVAMMVKE